MNELQIITFENTEISSWNFEELKTELQKRLDFYAGLVYSDDSIKDAKSDRATLNKVKKRIEDARKAYKEKCLAPYNAIEPQIKELVSMVDQQKELIDETVKAYETRQKEAKEKDVRKYYDKKAVVLGTLAEPLYGKLFDKKWVNPSTSKARYEEGIQAAISGALNDIEEIRNMDSHFEESLLDVYVQTLSLDLVKEKNEELTASAEKAGLIHAEDAEDTVAEAKTEPVAPEAKDGVTMRVYAEGLQLNQLFDFMNAIGIDYELL